MADDIKWQFQDEFPAEIRALQTHLGVLWVTCADGSLWMIRGLDCNAERVHVRTPAPTLIDNSLAAVVFTAPNERLFLNRLETIGIPVRADPECPAGEAWLELANVPRLVIRNVAVPETSNG